MKLATLNDGTRDGVLVVVSNDLTQCTAVGHIAQTLQKALEAWESVEPRLRRVAEGLETGSQPVQRFREHEALSPLPRAYQWLDGSAYLSHAELVRKARGADFPQSLYSDPLMYQGASDGFYGPREDIAIVSEDHGADLEGEIAVVVGDVPMGASREEALAAIRLIMLVNDVSLRNLIPAELAKGFGFINSKPSTAFSPVAITPDALGDAWSEGKLSGTFEVAINNQEFGRLEASADMNFDFGDLITHAAKTRKLAAGTIIGSGTVSNRDGTSAAKPVAAGGAGYSCIAELRMIETIASGEPSTSFLAFGDVVRIEMKDADGRSIFGAIEQRVASA